MTRVGRELGRHAKFNRRTEMGANRKRLDCGEATGAILSESVSATLQAHQMPSGETMQTCLPGKTACMDFSRAETMSVCNMSDVSTWTTSRFPSSHPPVLTTERPGSVPHRSRWPSLSTVHSSDGRMSKYLRTNAI